MCGLACMFLATSIMQLLYCAVCWCCVQLDDLENLKYDDLTAVAKLTSDPHYQSIMAVSNVQNMLACVATAAVVAADCIIGGRKR